GGATPSSTDSAPASPSPAVLDQLISQARAHGQAAQEQQRAMQRPLPVQVASASGHQYGQMPSQAPLPVRSLPNTHARYSQGQMSGQQGSPQILHQGHIPQRRTQFGAVQAQLASSNSPHHSMQPGGVDGSRAVGGDNNDDSSRRFHTPHGFKMDEDGGASSDIMCFTPLGSGQEVGRSCHLLHFKGKKILLDCGVHPGMHGVDALPFVDFIDIEEIDLLL
ncbi:hypothetical protein ANCDUO_24224, partial [Ancylostoma duodenale]